MFSSFLQKHNKQVTQYVTRNLIYSTFVLGLSVFTFGFETTVLSTTQAMTRKTSTINAFGLDRN